MPGTRETAIGRTGILVLLVLAALCSRTGPGDRASLVARLDATIPAVIAAGNAPSTQVAVVHDGRIVWSRAFGENTSVDHVYMNASVQKTFTAAAVLQLVEAGLVDLDADVGEYLPFPVRHPEFPGTPITTRMLLAHRSGLDAFPHQFAWDTESAFAPDYRPACPENSSTRRLTSSSCSACTQCDAPSRVLKVACGKTSRALSSSSARIKDEAPPLKKRAGPS
jgi:CubicO group peptidase (beta-lactamase class C family)